MTHEDLIPYLIRNGFEVTEQGYDQDGEYKTHIAFSRLATRLEVGKGAIIST